MRLLASLGVGVLGLTLWSLGLWRGGLPVEVTVRPAARPVAPPAPRWLSAAVTATVPGLDGWAVGDAVQVDRYGLLPPVGGSRLCVPVVPDGGAIRVTALGGHAHAGVVRLALVAPGTPGCDPAGLEPLVSQYP